MDIADIEKLPHLNPTSADLLARISNLRGSRRDPSSMAMSPATWERLKAEPGQTDCIEVGDDRRFHGIPVRLYEDCLGVAIGYSQT